MCHTKINTRLSNMSRCDYFSDEGNNKKISIEFLISFIEIDKLSIFLVRICRSHSYLSSRPESKFNLSRSLHISNVSFKYRNPSDSGE